MKKLLVFSFLIILPSFSIFAQNKMTINFVDDLVVLKIIGKSIAPKFTPGNHHLDDFLSFFQKGNDYRAILPSFQRGMSSGRLNGLIIYHISSGYVPNDLNKSLSIRIEIPKGKNLIWHNKIWDTSYAEQTFKNYFVAREFPIILVEKGSYVKRTSFFNQTDSMSVICVLENDSNKVVLPKVFSVVDSAASLIGALAPVYWHKFIVNYDKQNYTLVYIINNKGVKTGLEHYNAPYIISTPSSVSVEGTMHTLLHSFIGKALIPKEYMKREGKFYPSDALGFYEGLTTFISMRYAENFSAHLSASIYRSKLNADCNDLMKMGICGAENEKWYSAGYLFWIYMQTQGMDVEDFTRWLFNTYLINIKIPTKIDWSMILNFISAYDIRLGEIAQKSYEGAYLTAFETLKEKGWSPISVYKIPRWYDLYIGPYSLVPNGVQLPTDKYWTTKAYPVYLVSEGNKLPLEPKKDNPALMFIKAHPDSSFHVQFSDGVVRYVENKLKFSDGTPYFMHGVIDINEKNINFWRKLNVYIK